MVRRGMLLRVTGVGHGSRRRGSRWLALMGDTGNGEEELADSGGVTLVHGLGELAETGIEPCLRRRDWKQPRDRRVFGLPDLFVCLAEVLRKLFAGSDANDLDRDVHVDLATRELDHPPSEIDDGNRLSHLQHEDVATLRQQ